MIMNNVVHFKSESMKSAFGMQAIRVKTYLNYPPLLKCHPGYSGHFLPGLRIQVFWSDPAFDMGLDPNFKVLPDLVWT